MINLFISRKEGHLLPKFLGEKMSLYYIPNSKYFLKLLLLQSLEVLEIQVLKHLLFVKTMTLQMIMFQT